MLIYEKKEKNCLNTIFFSFSLVFTNVFLFFLVLRLIAAHFKRLIGLPYAWFVKSCHPQLHICKWGPLLLVSDHQFQNLSVHCLCSYSFAPHLYLLSSKVHLHPVQKCGQKPMFMNLNMSVLWNISIEFNFLIKFRSHCRTEKNAHFLILVQTHEK